MDLTKLTPWGMAANAVGGAISLVGAFGKKSEAEKQLEAQRTYAQQQRSAFNTGYGDLLSQAKGAATYQGDISRFQKVEQQADLAKRMASGQSRGAGEQIARDQAAQTSANALAAATRGAGSGTDIMTAALLSQQGENQAQNVISARSAQEQMANQNMAQQQQFAALGQTAAAAARERGLEFSSLANKQANIMGITQNKLEGEMNLNQSLFEGEQAKAAALQEAKSAIWSGIGGIASGIGSGMMSMGNQAMQLKNLKSLYPSITDAAIKNRPEVAALMGNPLTGATGQNLSLPSLGGFALGAQQKMTPQQSFDSQYSWNPVNKEWFSTAK
jgi:hypothetical protein